MRSRPFRRSIPAVVKQLGVVSFFNDFASEMVYPLLPTLITSRLGGTALAVGVLDGVAEAVAATVKWWAGWLADRPRWRRPLVVGGYVIAALARPVMAVSGTSWHVVTLRGVDRFGKGARTPPRDAIIADETSASIRGRAFGYHRGMDHAGAVLGPVVAWAVISALGASVEDVILWSLAPGIAAVLVVGWATRRIHTPVGPPTDPRRDRSAPSAAASRTLLVLIVTFAFLRFPEALFLLRLQELGIAVAGVPLVWAALHVIRAGASYPGGWLSDRLGARPTMAAGWVWYGVVCVGLALASGALSGVLWFLSFGLVAAATEAPERAFVAASGLRGARGRRFGIYHAAVGVAALPGGLLFGELFRVRGGAVALGVSGTAALVLGMLALARR